MALFANTQLSSHVAKLSRQVREEISDLEAEDLTDRAAVVRKFVPDLVGGVPVIRPEGTRFETSDGAAGVRVTATVPVDGKPFYLGLIPDGADRKGVAGSFQGDTVASLTASIVLIGDFNADATGEQVKTWAREQLEVIQSWLDQLRQECQAADVVLQTMVERAVDDRRRAVSAAARLKDELGEGL